MKMTLTITEEFGDLAAVTEFAHRVKLALSMPAQSFERLAAALAGSAVLQQNTHRTAAEAPAPAVSVAEYPAAATPSYDARQPQTAVKSPDGVESVNVGGAAPATATPRADSPTPPADVAPKAKRGRPSNAERAAAEAPKANTGGASGVTADVVTAPAKLAAHPLQEALKAGEAEALAEKDYSAKCLQFIAADQSTYIEIVKTFGVNSGRQVPAEKRAEFLAECARRIEVAAAA